MKRKSTGRFPARLLVECIPKREDLFRFAVHVDFVYITSEDKEIIVPAGFKTDFASVPRFFQRLFPATGKYNEATVVHDWLCYQWKKGKFDRREADLIFLEAMRTLDVKGWKRRLMYTGVGVYTFGLLHRLIKLKKGAY